MKVPSLSSGCEIAQFFVRHTASRRFFLDHSAPRCEETFAILIHSGMGRPIREGNILLGMHRLDARTKPHGTVLEQPSATKSPFFRQSPFRTFCRKKGDLVADGFLRKVFSKRIGR